jgi:hypothetical protein
MIVVSDTSSLIALAAVKRLDLLQQLFGSVVIPPAVHAELSMSSFNVSSAIESSAWIEVKQPDDEKLLQNLLSLLDKGESEAIVLAKELHADFLVIDERRGRQEAKRHQIPIIGLLGVIAKARRAGLIEQVKPLVDRIIHDVGFRVSPRLYSLFLEEVGETP